MSRSINALVRDTYIYERIQGISTVYSLVPDGNSSLCTNKYEISIARRGYTAERLA